MAAVFRVQLQKQGMYLVPKSRRFTKSCFPLSGEQV
jgi:hypothetical protein